MPDFSNNRYFIIAREGKPGVTPPLSESGPESNGELVGIDAMGRMLLVADRRPKGPMDGAVGIADVLRFDRRTRRVDTVATLTQPAGEKTAASMMGAGMMRMATNLPLAARDLTAIASDGRIALVRATPYRVEWIGTDGTRVQGPVADASIIRITDAENEAFTCSQIRPGALLRGGAGLRKLRWGAEGRGKRGGVRTIYYWAVDEDVCFMLYMFSKNEQGDLTQKQFSELARLVREEFK